MASQSSASHSRSAPSAPIRLRGGRNQKRKALGDAANVQPVRDLRARLSDSELSLELVDSWTRGLSSAAEIQKLASKSYNDMVKVLALVGQSDALVPSSLRSIASLGDWGKYSGNVAVELKRWLGEPSLPPPMNFSVPMLVKKPRCLTTIHMGCQAFVIIVQIQI